MADWDRLPDGVDPESLSGLDLDRPSVARLYDFFLGGRHNFAADRELGRRLLETEPNARLIVQENRAFLGRAVRYLLDQGVRQFIDLGSGIPTQENVHEIAQRTAPDAKVVYVDNDSSAVRHSRMILVDNDNAAVICEDLRDPASVLGHPHVRRLIDIRRPVGLLMVTVLHFIPDSDDPHGIVARYRDALAADSYLAVSHATSDAAPSAAAAVQDLYRSTSAAAHTRSHAEVSRFFEGFELVDPGVVYLPEWRPVAEPTARPEQAWFYAGVGHLVHGR